MITQYGAVVWPGNVWDEGISWRTERLIPPDDLPLDVEYVRDKVIRVANDDFDNDMIARYIKAATEIAEDRTSRALMPQTLAQTMSGLPYGRIELARFPVIGVTSIVYVDADGEAQTLTGSPAEFQLAPSGRNARAQLEPLSGASWPSPIARQDAVTITYEAGYVDDEQIPEAILTGISILTREMYAPTMTPEQLESTLRMYFRPVY